jgi:hypothetical protein
VQVLLVQHESSGNGKLSYREQAFEEAAQAG